MSKHTSISNIVYDASFFTDLGFPTKKYGDTYIYSNKQLETCKDDNIQAVLSCINQKRLDLMRKIKDDNVTFGEYIDECVKDQNEKTRVRNEERGKIIPKFNVEDEILALKISRNVMQVSKSRLIEHCDTNKIIKHIVLRHNSSNTHSAHSLGQDMKKFVQIEDSDIKKISEDMEFMTINESIQMDTDTDKENIINFCRLIIEAANNDVFDRKCSGIIKMYFEQCGLNYK